MSYGTQTMLKCIGELLLASHWYACAIVLLAGTQDDVKTTWLGPHGYGFCETRLEEFVSEIGSAKASGPSTVMGSAFETLGDGCEHVQLGSLYLAAFSVSAMLITGTGGADSIPSRVNDGEGIVLIFLLILGAFLWTRVLANFCEVATNGDPALTVFRQSLDGMNTFVNDMKLPIEMARRLREYVHQQREVKLREDAARKALPMLSPALQIEVVMYCHRHWLQGIWFLKEFDEEACLVRLAMSIASRTLAPREVAPRRNLYIIAKGLAFYGGRVLSPGMSWGDDVILDNPKQ